MALGASILGDEAQDIRDRKHNDWSDPEAKETDAANTGKVKSIARTLGLLKAQVGLHFTGVLVFWGWGDFALRRLTWGLNGLPGLRSSAFSAAFLKLPECSLCSVCLEWKAWLHKAQAWSLGAGVTHTNTSLQHPHYHQPVLQARLCIQ